MGSFCGALSREISTVSWEVSVRCILLHAFAPASESSAASISSGWLMRKAP